MTDNLTFSYSSEKEMKNTYDKLMKIKNDYFEIFTYIAPKEGTYIIVLEPYQGFADNLYDLLIESGIDMTTIHCSYNKEELERYMPELERYMPNPKKKVVIKPKKVVPVQRKIKEEKAEKKYQCKLSILKILVNSVILETIGAVREGYITNDPIRLEMDGVIIDNIEDVLKKIEDSIPLCEDYMKFIDTNRLEKLIIELEYLDVTKSGIYAEEIWNVYAPALLSI